MRINTKLIMTASASSLALLGITLTFLASETANYLQAGNLTIVQLLFQVVGALYLGFAALNWMAKAHTMGGIYSRPLVMANFGNYFIGGLAILKCLKSHPDLPTIIWIIGCVYAIFAVLFAFILFRSPVK
ncbi:MAG: hypothetical protein ACXVMS_10135 [Flavisolibacter sp.]